MLLSIVEDCIDGAAAQLSARNYKIYEPPIYTVDSGPYPKFFFPFFHECLPVNQLDNRILTWAQRLIQQLQQSFSQFLRGASPRGEKLSWVVSVSFFSPSWSSSLTPRLGSVSSLTLSHSRKISPTVQGKAATQVLRMRRWLCATALVNGSTTTRRIQESWQPNKTFYATVI